MQQPVIRPTSAVVRSCIQGTANATTRRPSSRQQPTDDEWECGSLADVPLSPIGVRSLNPDGPNSTLLGNLPRTLPKREPRRGYAKCFGQRFEHVHAGLSPLLNVGNGARTELNQSRKGSLRQPEFRSQGSETFPHAVRCRCPLICVLFTETIP